MTATTEHLDPNPIGADEDPSDEPDHVICRCNPNRALCGTDVSNAEMVEYAGPTPDDCIVCTDLESKPCQNCGE